MKVSKQVKSVKNEVKSSVKNLEKSSSKKSKKAIVIKKNFNHLLLTYSYFLNNENTKIITIGFDSTNFSPTIQLGKIGKSILTWNVLDWITFTFHACSIQNNLNNNINISISFTNFMIHNSDGQIFIKNNISDEEIEFTSEEIWIVLKLIEYFNTIIFHYKSCAVYVQEYYNQYVVNCASKDLFYLNTTDYFIPPADHYQLNYYRLFYEIPIICKEKLLSDVMNNMLSNEILK